MVSGALPQAAAMMASAAVSARTRVLPPPPSPVLGYVC